MRSTPLALLVILGSAPLFANEVSFRNEVMAVFSRGGCNQGACHGNQNGKNGFKLSLRGQDPDFDLRSLKRDMLGRRVTPHQPDNSLLLLKASGQMPHEGGRRFSKDSEEYRILRAWIANGLKADPPDERRLTKLQLKPTPKVLIEPKNEFQIEVMATFSDGTERDVTGLSVFESTTDCAEVDHQGHVTKKANGQSTILVRYLNKQAVVPIAFVPHRSDFVWSNPKENNYIDKLLFAHHRKLRMNPSMLSTDQEFLRRAYLDVLGILPTAKEAREFLADQREDKREHLIEALLRRPEFADFWALKWSDLLRNEERTLDRKGVAGFHKWLREAFVKGTPLNELARELISAQGRTYKNPPANYYRALRDPQIRAEATAQVFLGIRIQCARCHNHPFDRWTQDDYHSLAAFFSKIKYKIIENKKADKLDKHEFVGEQIISQSGKDEVVNPRTGKKTLPRFLTSTARLKEGDRLKALADWVASPKNPFFARAQVNRIWYHFFGRGLVEPNDDFRASNPAICEPLLDAMAKDLVAKKFDLRAMIRTILQSRAYQLSSIPNETNREDKINFTHALVRSLQAEQLLDGLAHVTGGTFKLTGYEPGMRAGQIPGVRAIRVRKQAPSDADKFLTLFGKPPRSLSCECERSTDTTLTQAFQLITGKVLNEMLQQPDNCLKDLLKRTDVEIMEELYLSSLCRLPSTREREGLLRLLKSAKDRRKAWEDILWGLLCSKEFLLRR